MYSAESDQNVGLGLVLESALDAVIVMRKDGTVADWNGEAERIFGWVRAEVVDRQLAELIIPESYRHAHHKGLAHYLQTGAGPVLRKRIEISAVRRNGEEFPVELSISPVTDGDEVYFLGFIRDISERTRTQKLLQYEARKATLLHELTSMAAEAGPLTDVLRCCLDSICELTGWPVGHAYLPADGGLGELVPTRIWHAAEGKYDKFREVTEKSPLHLGEGLPGHIWKTKEALWISDVSKESADFPRFRKQPDLEIRAAFGIPVMSGGDVVAILEFFNDQVAEQNPRLLITARTFGDQLGRVLERRKTVESERLLLAELNHRVKNMLAVVIGIATQTAKTSTSVSAFEKNFHSRLVSLSRTHNLLTSTLWQQTDIRDLIEEVVGPHLKDGSQLDQRGGHVSLSPKATLAMSMILHELVTNAVKYGALSVPHGRIYTKWAELPGPSGARLAELTWSETGMDLPQAPIRHGGFGTKLINASIHHELAGTVETDFKPEGVQYRFRFSPDR